jgi:hypothetical protein
MLRDPALIEEEIRQIRGQPSGKCRNGLTIWRSVSRRSLRIMGAGSGDPVENKLKPEKGKMLI